MYKYTKREMTPREIQGAYLGLVIRSMVRFQQIHAKRVAECQNEKWQQILQEVKQEVTEALLVRCDLATIQAYTKELHAMDVSEFFPKEELPASSAGLAKTAIMRAMTTQKTPPPIYHVRRRAREWQERPARTPSHISH